MTFKKFSLVSRNKDINYNLQTQPITVTQAYTNVLEIAGDRINDTVFTLHNTAEAVASYSSETLFDSEFADPRGLAIDPRTGNIYVVDETSDILKVFNIAGDLLFSFGGTGTGDGEFENAFSCRIFDTKLFVVEEGNDRISVFDLDGRFITKFGHPELSSPQDIAVDSNGIFYVPNNADTKVHMFDRDFRYRGLIDPVGDVSSVALNSIAINSQNIIYAGDTSQDNILIFKTNGELINIFGTGGTGTGQFNDPTSIVILPNDDVAISDTENGRVQVFSKDGIFLYAITGFDSVRGIDFYPENNSIITATLSTFNDGFINESSINLTESASVFYKVYGSSNLPNDFSDSTNNQWVNLLSVRDIEQGGSSSYDHDFSIGIPINDRTYESFSNSWKSVLVQVSVEASITRSTLAAYSRGQSS